MLLFLPASVCVCALPWKLGFPQNAFGSRDLRGKPQDQGAGQASLGDRRHHTAAAWRESDWSFTRPNMDPSEMEDGLNPADSAGFDFDPPGLRFVECCTPLNSSKLSVELRAMRADSVDRIRRQRLVRSNPKAPLTHPITPRHNHKRSRPCQLVTAVIPKTSTCFAQVPLH